MAFFVLAIKPKAYFVCFDEANYLNLKQSMLSILHHENSAYPAILKTKAHLSIIYYTTQLHSSHGKIHTCIAFIPQQINFHMKAFL